MRKPPTRRLLTVFFATAIIVALCLLLLDSAFPPPLGDRLVHSFDVLDRHGERLRLYTNPRGDWRLPADAGKVDRTYLDMLLAFEDKRFHQHPGVDILALIRAVGQALRHGRFVSGGSTLTMQTVRLLEPRPRTLANKLLEMFRALQLESRLSKDEILDLYLTLAPYGGNLQGIRAASLLYFDKEPSFLTNAEAALLVALPQSPERRRPDRFFRRAGKARDAVLDRMVESGVLSAKEVEAAKRVPIPRRRRPVALSAAHLADRLKAEFPSAGAVQTTLDGSLQRRLELLAARHQQAVPPEVTLAILVLHNADASVLAYLGSGDYFASRFPGQVDMVRALRSPGSALKPFIYGMAFDAGFLHPETLISDLPGPVRGYGPGNFDGRFHGEIPVREALRASRNIPAVKVLERLGPGRFVKALMDAGAGLQLPESVEKAGLPVALGGVGIRLEKLTALYSGLAGSGVVRDVTLAPSSSKKEGVDLLSPAASWYLTDILKSSSRPPGFVHDNDDIAFKTGTSYGFRDAWAVGYTPGHTVGVWVGRPDGGFTAGLSGLSSAVPVMLEVFGLLPEASAVALPEPRPESLLLAENEQLPPGLRYFDRLARPSASLADADAGPRILYPPDGGVVHLDSADDSVQLEVRGGEAPYHWLENGRFLDTKSTTQMTWPGTSPGFARLTVIDAKGRSARVEFEIAMERHVTTKK